MRFFFIIVLISIESSFGNLDFSSVKNPQCVSLAQKCRSVETAVECIAVEECIPIWKNAKLLNLPENSVPRLARYQPGGKCASCESLASAVEEMIEMKAQRRVSLYYVRGLCKSIKDADAVDHCKLIVDRYFDALFDMIAAHIDKGVACSLLDACAHRTLSFDALDARHTNVGNSEPSAEPLPRSRRARGSPDLQFLPSAPHPVLPTLSDEARVRAAWAPLEAASAGSPQVCADCKRALDDLLDLAYKSQGAGSTASPTSCELCLIVVNLLDNLLENNKTEESVIAALEKVCYLVPNKFRQTCDMFIDMYGEVLIRILLEDLAPDVVCAHIELCLSDSQNVPYEQLPAAEQAGSIVGEGEKCMACELVISRIESLLGDKRTEQEIVDALDRGCLMIPKAKEGGYDLRSECQSIIQTYGPSIIQLLLKSVTPAQMCAAFKLCNGDKQPAPAASKLPEQSPQCDLCEQVVRQIEEMIADNKTEQAIVEALEKVCYLLPSKYRKECDDFVKQYAEQIIKLLLQEMPPKEICAALGLCSSEQNLPNYKTKIEVESSPQCEMCQIVVTQIESMIEQNKTEQAIIEALEKVCYILPSKYRKECDDFVKQYAEQIIELLLKDLPPKEVCSALGLCSKKQKSTAYKHKTEIEVKASPQCEICQMIVTQIESMIEQNKTEQAIIEALEKVCYILPSKYRKECDDFVKQYAEQIIELLLKDLPPKEVCSALGLCSQKQKSTYKHKVEIEVKASPQCEICQMIVSQIESMIEQNKTEEAIIEALEKVCYVLPSKYRKECDDFIKQYAEQIIKLLLMELSPKEVCVALDLCSKTLKTLVSEAAVLLGGSTVSCERCDRAVESIKAIFSHKETVEEAKVVLKFLCTSTGIKESECDSLVEQWVPAFVNLVARVSAREVCVILEFCPASNAGEKKRADALEKTVKQHISSIMHDMKLIKPGNLNPRQNILHLLSSSSYAAKVHIIPESNTKPALKSAIPVTPCGLCIFVLHKVEQIVVTNRSEEAVTEALEHVCSMLPAHARKECDDFVDKYFERVLDLFLKGVAPEAICMAVGLCETSRQARNDPALELPLLTPRTKKLGVELQYPCLACQFTAMQASMALFYEPYYKSIGGWVEKNLCSKLALEERACKQFIDSEVPHLLKQLGAKIDPTNTCEAFKMCAPGENPPWLGKSRKLGAQVKDEMCTACRYLEDLLRAFIEDMKHQNEIIDFLVNEGCNKTKDHDLENVCESLIRTLAPSIFMLIGDALDRDQACFALGICPNTTLAETKPAAVPTKPQNEDECAVCKLSISEIRVAVLNPITQDIIAKQLDTKLCPGLKPMDDVCRAYVKDYLPVAFSLLSKYLNAEMLCGKMGFCKKSLEDTSEIAITLPSAITRFQSNKEACQLCDVGLATARALLLQPVVKSSLQSFLNAHVCPSMGEYAQACLGLVRMEMPLVFDALNKLLTSENICSKFLKFCDKSSESAFKSAKEGEVCAGCKLLLTSARTLIQTHQTQILGMISREVCPHLGGASAECEDWVQHLGPLIVQSLLSELDPDTLCNELNFCGTEILARILKSRLSDKESPEICVICKFIITELKVMISKPDVQEKVEDFLENKVCPLEKSFESVCKQFVKDQLPALLEALTNVLGDSRLCQVMKACDSEISSNIFGNILSHLSSGNLCNDCKQVVNQLKTLLETPTYEESLVLVIIKEVCPHMSKPTECELAVRLAGKRVISELAARLDSTKVCAEFNLCKSAYANLPSIEPPAASSVVCQRCQSFFAPGVCVLMRMCPASVATPRNDAECDLCKQFANEIITYAKDPQVRKAILDFLHTEVCSEFGQFKDQCNALVDEYVTAIFAILSQLTPEQFCELAGICPSKLILPADQQQMAPALLRREPQPVPNRRPPVARPLPLKGVECSLCKEIVSSVEGKLVQRTETEVIARLISECNSLKYPEMRIACDKFVNDSGKLVVDLILQDMTPDVICKFGGYCSSAVQLVGTPNTPFSLHCAACRLVYSDAQCLYMRLCSALEGVSEPPIYSEAYTSSVRDNIECQLCEQLLQPLWIYLENNETIAQVAQIFGELCEEKFLVPDLQGMCHAIVLELVTDTVNALLDKYTPAWVCKNEVHVCNSTDMPLSLRISQLRAHRKSGASSKSAQIPPKKPIRASESEDPATSGLALAADDEPHNLIPRRAHHRNLL